jgi:hypothetical protein
MTRVTKFAMTHYTLADLAMADRHIAEGETHIVRQEELLAVLRSRGQPTKEAETLLRLLNDTQVEHRKHRDAIAKALEDAQSSERPDRHHR